MTGKKGSRESWLKMTVVLRSDLYEQALGRGIDISDACNQALAGLTGCEFYPQREKPVPPPPVIIARAGSTPLPPKDIGSSPVENLPPVINADDPASPARVVQEKAARVKNVHDKTGTPPVSAGPPAPEPVSTEQKPGAAAKKAAARTGHTTASKKRAKGDGLKTFFSSRITRTDDPGDCVGKDELYEIFVRFCRDHRIMPVPERKTVAVALKNQFALTEKPVDGKSCWTGIRLK